MTGALTASVVLFVPLVTVVRGPAERTQLVPLVVAQGRQPVVPLGVLVILAAAPLLVTSRDARLVDGGVAVGEHGSACGE